MSHLSRIDQECLSRVIELLKCSDGTFETIDNPELSCQSGIRFHSGGHTVKLLGWTLASFPLVYAQIDSAEYAPIIALLDYRDLYEECFKPEGLIKLMDRVVKEQL